MARLEMRLPQLSMGMADATVIAWLKQVGDHVDEGEPLVEIDTGKAAVELEAPEGGTLIEIVAQVDELIDVGELLGVIDT